MRLTDCNHNELITISISQRQTDKLSESSDDVCDCCRSDKSHHGQNKWSCDVTPQSELMVTDMRTLTGGRAGFADVSERAVDWLLGLVSMFPQQDEADLLS